MGKIIKASIGLLLAVVLVVGGVWAASQTKYDWLANLKVSFTASDKAKATIYGKLEVGNTNNLDNDWQFDTTTYNTTTGKMLAAVDPWDMSEDPLVLSRENYAFVISFKIKNDSDKVMTVTVTPPTASQVAAPLVLTGGLDKANGTHTKTSLAIGATALFVYTIALTDYSATVTRNYEFSINCSI